MNAGVSEPREDDGCFYLDSHLLSATVNVWEGGCLQGESVRTAPSGENTGVMPGYNTVCFPEILSYILYHLILTTLGGNCYFHFN